MTYIAITDYVNLRTDTDKLSKLYSKLIKRFLVDRAQKSLGIYQTVGVTYMLYVVLSNICAYL